MLTDVLVLPHIPSVKESLAQMLPSCSGRVLDLERIPSTWHNRRNGLTPASFPISVSWSRLPVGESPWPSDPVHIL